jgi:DNA-binding MarR family transcriptional regulator
MSKAIPTSGKVHADRPDPPYTKEERILAERLFRAFGMISHGPLRQVQGVTQGEMALLGFLQAGGAPMAPTDLAEKLGLTTARIANILNSLERKGLVLRSHDATDRRRVEVSITSQGSALLRSNLDEAISGLSELVRELGIEDAREFARITGRIEVLVSEREHVTIPPAIPLDP